ncbi:MAG: O-antigen ligase family protein [Pyrinomonadaceae bacterium]
MTAADNTSVNLDDYPAATVWLDRSIIFWLFVFAAFAPHSIAVTQGAWLFALLFWGLRLLVRPRLAFPRSPVLLPILVFFGVTVVSSVLSYERAVSVGKLRAAALFTIVLVVAHAVRAPRIRCALALVLLASSLVGVGHTVIQRALGRGVQVEGVVPNGPLTRGIFRAESGQTAPLPVVNGDTLMEIDGQKVINPDQIVNALSDASRPGPARLRIYHLEGLPIVELPRGGLLNGTTAEERLGFTGWRRARDWRAGGLYGQYVTFAETLQLTASLAFGFFIAFKPKRSLAVLLFLVAFGGLCLALLLTATRASELGLLVSAFVIVVAGASRRGLIVLVAVAIPLVLAGMFVVQQYRQVGLVDKSDGSTQWRVTVWREGFGLLVSKPRHLLVGVGMDSIKTHWREWNLFDSGKLPPSHMHNTPLQLALERGVPALLIWLWLLFAYARWLWMRLRTADRSDWCERGILLGAMGGMAGFFISGMLHYNLGDSEVAMIFYFLLGLTLVSRKIPVAKTGGN